MSDEGCLGDSMKGSVADVGGGTPKPSKQPQQQQQQKQAARCPGKSCSALAKPSSPGAPATTCGASASQRQGEAAGNTIPAGCKKVCTPGKCKQRAVSEAPSVDQERCTSEESKASGDQKASSDASEVRKHNDRMKKRRKRCRISELVKKVAFRAPSHPLETAQRFGHVPILRIWKLCRFDTKFLLYARGCMCRAR